MLFELPTLDWWSIAPVLAMTITGCLVMLVDLFTQDRKSQGHLPIISL